MTFETESGSVYEFDAANRRVRQLFTKTAPTARTPLRQEWRDCIECRAKVGLCGVIYWQNIMLPDGQFRMECTWTSLVVKVTPDASA